MSKRGSLTPFTLAKLKEVRQADKHGLGADYGFYLQTKHWQNTRKAYLKSDYFEGGCFICGGSFEQYHIHHKSYSLLGEEPLTHLVAVCSICHEEIHNLLRVLGGDYLWPIADKLKSQLQESRNAKPASIVDKRPKGECSLLTPSVAYRELKYKPSYYCVRCMAYHKGRPKYINRK